MLVLPQSLPPREALSSKAAFKHDVKELINPQELTVVS